MNSLKKLGLLIIIFSTTSVIAHDVLLEFKGAYFHPTNDRFRKIYKNGALYGPEVTFQLCQDSCWYGFASIDFFHKRGHSIGLHTPTSIRLVPLGFGLKYIIPSCYECINWYAGIGFQPIHVSIENNSPAVPDHSKWAYGGIAKFGALIDVYCNFFVDVFVDYSFAHLHSIRTSTCCGPEVPLKTSISGVVVGAGLGYRF